MSIALECCYHVEFSVCPFCPKDRKESVAIVTLLPVIIGFDRFFDVFFWLAIRKNCVEQITFSPRPEYVARRATGDKVLRRAMRRDSSSRSNRVCMRAEPFGRKRTLQFIEFLAI